MKAPLSSDRLKLARWLRKITQKELSERSGLSQSHISKLENELTDPDDGDAAVLEQALDLTPGFLTKPGTRSTLPEHFYRKRASMLVRDERWIESIVVLARQGVASLSESVNIDPVFDLPQVPVGSSSVKTPRDAANFVRQALMVPEGPIRDLAEVIESTGVIIVPIHKAPAKFDAMASPATIDCPWNLIFYNPEMPGDRLRFTLAHEFGHLVMHRTPSEDCEDEANEFASEFLTPEKLLGPYLHNLDLARAVELKRIWKVSIGSLVYQANKQERITANKYKSLQVMISQRGWRRNEPVEIPRAMPRVFSELINAHRDHLGYSWDDIGSLFGVRGCEFIDRHTDTSEPRVMLRVIK